MNYGSRFPGGAIGALLLICLNAYSNIIYVENSATGSNTGSSWVDAYTSLQSALSAASSGDTIVVGRGYYSPHASDRTVSFELKEGVVMLGSFDGTESKIDSASIASRDFEVNPSVLTGDLAGDDSGFSNNDENSYHVVFSECLTSSITSATVVDGFIIHGGNANYYTGSVYDDLRGGGIFLEANAPYSCSPTFRNIMLYQNSAQFGGGLAVVSFNNTGDCSPSFENFIVMENRTWESDDTQLSNGAGIFISTTDGTANPTFSMGAIMYNTVTEMTYPGTGGGVLIVAGIFSSDAESSPVFSDVVFCGNSASGGGAHINMQAQGAGSLVAPSFTNISMAGYADSYPVYNSSIGGAGAVCTPSFINALIHTTYSTSVLNSPSPASSGPAPVFDHSNIRGAFALGYWSSSFGTDAGNNIDEIPHFYDTTGCEVTLYETSPEIGSGNGTDGNNIGFYQGPGLIYLSIAEALDYASCSGDTTYTFSFEVRDETEDSVQYSTSTGMGMLEEWQIASEYMNDTLKVYIRVSDTLAGVDTIYIDLQNKAAETAATQFEFRLDKKPVLDGFDYGPFGLSDTTYAIVLHRDTTLGMLSFMVDGSESASNTFHDLKPGSHYAQTINNSCRSDTLFISLREYINDIPLTIDYYDDTTVYYLCGGDTTLILEFRLLDDNPDLIDFTFSRYYQPVIPPENVNLYTTDTSYYFEVVIPDTAGYYNIWVQATNIYWEFDEFFYEIYINQVPEIVSVTPEYYWNEGYYCLYPEVTGIQYTNLLKFLIDGVEVDNYPPICNIPPGAHTFQVIYDDCPSGLYYMDLDDPAGTAVSSGLPDPVKIYPIPAEEAIYLENVPPDARVQLFTLDGRPVIIINEYMPGQSIDISGLIPGIYLIRIDLEGIATQQKVVVQ